MKEVFLNLFHDKVTKNDPFSVDSLQIYYNLFLQ